MDEKSLSGIITEVEISAFLRRFFFSKRVLSFFTFSIKDFFPGQKNL